MIILSRPEDSYAYPSDIEIIKKILNSKGYTASDADIEYAWKYYSETFAASWLGLPNNEEEIFEIMKEQLDEIH